MNHVSRNIIGKNTRRLRLELGLSLYNFATLVDLSKASIVNIESVKKGYNLDLIDNIANFPNYSLSQLSNEDFVPDPHIREKLIKKYRNQLHYQILAAKPEIAYAVRYRLLRSIFFETPREIKEIREFFQSFGWSYLGTSISNVLKRQKNEILITPHPSKTNAYRYQKKLKPKINTPRKTPKS